MSLCMKHGVDSGKCDCQKKPNTSVSSTDLLGQVEHTERGFELIEFLDGNGGLCSLQQSSLAEYETPGSSSVWLGHNDKRMHLKLVQVKALILSLQRWVDEGSFIVPYARR